MCGRPSSPGQNRAPTSAASLFAAQAPRRPRTGSEYRCAAVTDRGLFAVESAAGVQLFDAAGEPLVEIPRGSVAASCSAPPLLAVAAAGFVHLLHGDGGELCGVLEAHEGEIEALCFDLSASQLLTTGGRDCGAPSWSGSG